MLFAERFVHLFQCPAIGLVSSVQRDEVMLHSQFDERYLSPGFAFGFAILIEIILVVIVSGVAIPAEAKVVRYNCLFPVIERLEG